MKNQLISMTGFGRAKAALGQRTVVVEIRSLNHRGLDLKLRCIDLQLAPEIEGEIVRKVRQSLVRGSVTISLRDEASDSQGGRWLDLPRLRQMHASLENLRVELGLPGSVDLATLGSFLSASKGSSTNEVPASDWAALAPAVDAALAGLLAMRVEEGAAARRDLNLRLGNLRAILEKVATLADGLPSRAGRRLEERLAGLLIPGTSVDPARLAQEVALLAERLDVSEELARLRAHLDHLGGLLDGSANDAPGRRVDFLAQEIGREFNTLGSKVQDSAISAMVIDGKAELEKLREQAQNVE
jgi:uncharacterized protein (TIGR00255 family)